MFDAFQSLFEPAEIVQRSAQVGVGDCTVRVYFLHAPVQRERLLIPLLAEPHHGKMIERLMVVRIAAQGVRKVLRRFRPAKLLRRATEEHIR